MIKTGQRIIGLAFSILAAALLLAGCNESQGRVGRLGIVHKAVVTDEPPVKISAEQQKNRAVAERHG